MLFIKSRYWLKKYFRNILVTIHLPFDWLIYLSTYLPTYQPFIYFFDQETKKYTILIQANKLKVDGSQASLSSSLSASLSSIFCFSFPPFLCLFVERKVLFAEDFFVCLCLYLVSIAQAEETHLRDRTGLIKCSAGSGSSDGLGITLCPK